MAFVLRLATRLAALGLLFGIVVGYGGVIAFQLDLLAHFRLHFLLLTVPVAIMALLLRDPVALWQAAVSAVLAGAGLMAHWHLPAPEAEGIPITVMTANIYLHNDRPAEMRRALIAADADILVTNETSTIVEQGESSLTQHYRHRVALVQGTFLSTVVWSKFPLRNGTMLGRNDPIGGHAVVQIAPDVEVLVFGLHLDNGATGAQEAQIARLEKIVAPLPKPRIILGDFNATPWSVAMRRVEELSDTRRVDGSGPTWQGSYPTPFGSVPELLGLPIDHILLSDGIGVESIEVLPIPGSDHDGVLARLRVPAEPRPSASAESDVSSPR